MEAILPHQHTLAGEFIQTFLGKQIGQGCSRTVYNCRIDPSLVIKVETDAGSFKNVREWELWDEIAGVKDIAKWFAPCVAISPCGSVLIQRRAEKCDKSKYPKQVPKFFGDMKYDNFGLLNGKFVCFDYANIPISDRTFKKGMMKAEWWLDTDYHPK